MKTIMMNNRSPIHTEIISYDIEKYPFHKIIMELLEVETLSKLKANTASLNQAFSYYKNMEQTPLFLKLYKGLDSEKGQQFYVLYRQFIVEVIRPTFNEDIYYQTKPSHRILYRDLQGQARYHRDSDYGHDPSEINYWLPQTAAFESNTIWIEEEENTENYKPINLALGEFVKFHGAMLSHGARPNTSDSTRVSFDFRVIPKSKYEAIAAQELQDNTHSKNPIMDNAKKFQLCEQSK